MHNELKDAQQIEKRVKDAYRRGLRDGEVKGLRRAVELSRQIITVTQAMEYVTQQPIIDLENKEI